MKKKRLISLIAAFSLVFTGVTAYVPSGVYAEENVQMENLVQGKAYCIFYLAVFLPGRVFPKTRT